MLPLQIEAAVENNFGPFRGQICAVAVPLPLDVVSAVVLVVVVWRNAA